MFSIVWFPALINIFAGYLFMSVAPLAGEFMTLFGTGYAGLSLFLSGIAWSHTFVQLPAGILLDRIGVYRGFLIAAAISLVACLLPFISPDNMVLATSLRCLAGLTSGSLFLAGVKIIAMIAPPDKIAVGQGIQGGAFSLGTMLPFATLPAFGPGAWHLAYLIPAGLAVLCFIASFLLPYAVRHPSKSEVTPVSELLTAVKKLVVSPPILLLGVFHGFSYGTLNNLGQWLPSILADLAGGGSITTWGYVAAVILFFGTAARMTGGLLLKWLTRNTLTNVSVFGITLLYIALGLSGNLYVSLAVGLGLGILGGINYGSLFSLTGTVSKGMYTATAAGIMNMVANIASVLLTIALGFVREATGAFSGALIAAGVIGLVFWVLGRRIVAKIA